MTIEEFIAALGQRNSPVIDNDVRGFERDIGAALPADYRRFIAETDGGFVGHFWHGDVGVQNVYGLNRKGDLSLHDQWREYSSDEILHIPASVLPIMDDPFGNVIGLVLAGARRGQIVLWDHEGGPVPETWDGSSDVPGNLRPIAETFTAFVRGLRPD